MYHDQIVPDKKEPVKYISHIVKSKGFLQKKIIIDEQELVYTALPKTQKDDTNTVYTCFISDRQDPQEVKETYKKRWNIEVFFKNIKTNGFNLEDLNITQYQRIKMVLCIVSFAYLLCIHEGTLQEVISPIPMKKHKNKTWKSKSTFKYGFEYIHPVFLSVASLLKYIRSLLQCSDNLFFIQQLKIP